jgi:hypothetical protein
MSLSKKNKTFDVKKRGLLTNLKPKVESFFVCDTYWGKTPFDA